MSGTREIRHGGTVPTWKAGMVAAALLSLAHVAVGQPLFASYRAMDHEVGIETRDSASARVRFVQVRQVDEQVAVTGYVEKRFSRGGPIPGKVAITVIGLDGEVIGTTESGYLRRSAHSGRGYFSKTLTIDPEEVRSVRVTHSGIGG